MVHRSYGASTIEDEDQHPSLRRLILEVAGDLAGLRITLLGEPHEAERHLVRQTEEHVAVQLPAIAPRTEKKTTLAAFRVRTMTMLIPPKIAAGKVF